MSVDQLSISDVCAVERMKCPDDVVYADGEKSISHYMCTVCTEQPVGCRCVDSMGSKASGRVSANQKARIRCSVKFNQAEGDSLPTEGGGTQASGTSFRNNFTINGRGGQSYNSCYV